MTADDAAVIYDTPMTSRIIVNSTLFSATERRDLELSTRANATALLIIRRGKATARFRPQLQVDSALPIELGPPLLRRL